MIRRGDQLRLNFLRRVITKITMLRERGAIVRAALCSTLGDFQSRCSAQFAIIQLDALCPRHRIE